MVILQGPSTYNLAGYSHLSEIHSHKHVQTCTTHIISFIHEPIWVSIKSNMATKHQMMSRSREQKGQYVNVNVFLTVCKQLLVNGPPVSSIIWDWP